MNDKPPPFAGYMPVGENEKWMKILSGEIAPYVYSGEARGDFEPVPISTAEFYVAEQASRDEEGKPDPHLRQYQIMWRDRDRRRPVATRRAIPVPHWVYIARQDLAPRKGKGGRPPRLDQATVTAEVCRLMDHHGEISPDDPDWNALVRLYDALRIRFGADFADNTLEPYVKKALAEWHER